MASRRAFIKGGIALAASPFAGIARAQAYPSRPVRFIVPLAPGGGLDFIARLVGEYISRGLGQQVFVENRTGAGGTIGIDLAIKAPPDGYSLLLTNDNVAAAPHVMKLNVDYLKDLMPVSLLGRQPQVWAVHPSFDVKSMAELVAEVKKAGTMGCATSGVGSNQHVLMEWFAKVADIKLEHVPYRGAGQAINDLLAGHVKVACLGPTATLPHAQAQKIRLLAQSGEARSPSMPEVPTLQEAGYKGVALESWYAAFAPLGTPNEIIARLNAEMDKACADQPTRDALAKTATDAVGGTTGKARRRGACRLGEVRAAGARAEYQDGMSAMKIAGVAVLALTLCAGSAVAQKSLKEQIVGTWDFTVAEVTAADGKKSFPFGETPKGILIFTPDGRFAQIHVAGDVPKFASGNRLTGTPEEYAAINKRSLSVFGTYTVDEEKKTVTYKIVSSTFPNWEGEAQTRTIDKLTADEFVNTNPNVAGGRGSAANYYKRAK